MPPAQKVVLWRSPPKGADAEAISEVGCRREAYAKLTENDVRLDPVGHRDMVGFRDPVGHGDGRSVVQLVVHCGQLFFEMVAQMVARPELFSWDGRSDGRRECDNYF